MIAGSISARVERHDRPTKPNSFGGKERDRKRPQRRGDARGVQRIGGQIELSLQNADIRAPLNAQTLAKPHSQSLVYRWFAQADVKDGTGRLVKIF